MKLWRPKDFAPVVFPRAVTGMQIAAMVQQVVAECTDGTDGLVYQEEFNSPNDRSSKLVLGRYSSIALHDHVRVVEADKGPDTLLKGWYYTSVAVIWHEWPVNLPMLLFNKDEVVPSILAFAKGLQQAYHRGVDKGFPEFDYTT